MTEPLQPDFEELSAYLDGELPPGRAAEVKAWLETHPETRKELEDLREIHAGLGAPLRAEHDLDLDSFTRKMWEEVDRERERARGGFVGGGFLQMKNAWIPLAAAAAVLLVMSRPHSLEPRRMMIAPGKPAAGAAAHPVPLAVSKQPVGASEAAPAPASAPAVPRQAAGAPGANTPLPADAAPAPPAIADRLAAASPATGGAAATASTRAAPAANEEMQAARVDELKKSESVQATGKLTESLAQFTERVRMELAIPKDKERAITGSAKAPARIQQRANPSADFLARRETGASDSLRELAAFVPALLQRDRTADARSAVDWLMRLAPRSEAAQDGLYDLEAHVHHIPRSPEPGWDRDSAAVNGLMSSVEAWRDYVRRYSDNRRGRVTLGWALAERCRRTGSAGDRREAASWIGAEEALDPLEVRRMAAAARETLKGPGPRTFR